MATNRIQFSEQIKRAIEASGMTRYQISQATGVEQSTLSRFVAGKAGLSIHALDALADLFDWKLTAGKAPGKGKVRKGKVKHGDGI